MIYRQEYIKPDGRKLWLYGRAPIELTGPILSPAMPGAVDTHLRYHPILQEWAVYASHRQDRTFLPSAQHDPLAPTMDPENPTELPSGTYDVAVFENRFPSLVRDPGPAPVVANAKTAPASGACEVVVFAQGATQSLGDMSLDRIALIIEVWEERTRALQQAGMAYACPLKTAAPKWA